MSEKKNFEKRTNQSSSVYRVVVIGTSAGGFDALRQMFTGLDQSFPLPVLIVQHMSPGSDDFMARSLNSICGLHVKEAEEKEKIYPGNIYIAPANYHLMVEEDETLSLSTDAKVNFCRPSIDVLFESAADVYHERLIGVILTGANSDGARGLLRIKENGGLTIVQDPVTAEVDIMPRSALNLFGVDYVLPVAKIMPFIEKFVQEKK